MNKTFYIVASADLNGYQPVVLPTLELAEAQASLWNFRMPGRPVYVVRTIELPTDCSAPKVAEAA